MKLHLTFRTPHEPAQNVAVVADATASVGDVAAALACGPQADSKAEGEVTLRVLGQGGSRTRVLPHDRTLVSSGVRSGAEVELAYAEEAPPPGSGEAVAVIRILSGPDAGVEIPLPAGTHSIGRAPECQLRLTDPMVSAHHASFVIDDALEIVDAHSSNGITVGGVQVARAPLAQGDIAVVGTTQLEVGYLKPMSQLASTSTDIAFTRPTVVLDRPTEHEVELPDSPTAQTPTHFPWLTLWAPLIMGVVMYAFTRQILSILFIALSPLMMLGTWWSTRSQYKAQLKAETATFNTQLAQAVAELDTRRQLERAQRLRLHPSVTETVAAVAEAGPVLWCRRPEHPEFLQVRLGLGTVIPLVRPAKPQNRKGLPHFLAALDRVVADHAALDQMPIVADLRSCGSLGICGNHATLDGVARATLAELIGLHSPAEVVLCCLTSAAGRSRWEWLEWLPHTASPHSPLPVNHLSADPGTGKELLEALEGLVATRTENVKQALRGPVTDGSKTEIPAPILPSVIVLVDQPLVDQGRVTRLAEQGPDAGVHLVWVADNRAAIPAACRTVLDVTDGSRSLVGMVREGLTCEPVQCESLDLNASWALARRLAPFVDAGAPTEDASDVPRSVPLVSVLGVDAADDAELVVTRWRENQSLLVRQGPPQPLQGKSSLRAVVGHTGVEPFTLDLRSQGPHALVGGTTGAGKSEFLQAWVLGLAHAYSPDKVTFLFVDYKGGSAFASCLKLPHCVGLVTDLTPYLVRRALRSLRAELRYREHLLNSKRAKDLLELEKTGDPECPPSLIIVVDEFAALVGEVPEFVDGVVDVAQRGRSLGLHLILATQRPAGVIKENLRANTNLRVALRMADETDSTDVLGTTMAAHFDPSIPGRGAAKTGPGRITQFQSAFPGSRTPAVPEAPPIEIASLSFGAGQPWRRPERASVTDGLPKDIDRVVDTVISAARQASVPAPRKPWLDSLAEVYNLAGLRQRRDSELVLGVLDDPDAQAQRTAYFYPDVDGNILYQGAGGSGKSTALRTLAIAAAITPSSGPVHVYALDFAGSALGGLTKLPHVGAVIRGDDEERVERLIRWLGDVVAERSLRYQSVNASTLTEYREHSGRRDEPRLLMLVDGFGAFRNDYEMSRGAIYDQFQQLLIDGRAVGLHFAISADRTNAIPTSVASAIPRRVVLRQADEEAYLMLGLPKDVVSAASPPGRAMQVGDPRELQLAILGDSSNLAVQARWAEELAQELAASAPTRTAPEPIRSLPDDIPAASLPAARPGQIVLGISDATLAPLEIDPRGVILVAGPPQSGRTNATRWLVEAVRRAHPGIVLVHLAPRRVPLSELPIWARSAVGDEVDAVVGELLGQVDQLESELRIGLVLEAAPEFTNTTVERDLTDLVTKLRHADQLVIAEGETSTWSSGYQLTNAVKAARTGLLLQADQMDGDSLLRTQLPRIKAGSLPPGRGFWIRNSRWEKAQLPWLG